MKTSHDILLLFFGYLIVTLIILLILIAFNISVGIMGLYFAISMILIIPLVSWLSKMATTINLDCWDGSHKCDYCKYFKVERSNWANDKEECKYFNNSTIETKRLGNYYNKNKPKSINPNGKCEWFERGRPTINDHRISSGN